MYLTMIWIVCFLHERLCFDEVRAATWEHRLPQYSTVYQEGGNVGLDMDVL